MTKTLCLLTLLLSVEYATAQQPSSSPGGSSSDLTSVDRGSDLLLAGGRSVAMLGSWERRIGGMIGFQTRQLEPKLTRFLGSHVDQFWQFYGLYHSGQDSRWSPDPTWSAGFLYGYRKNWVDQSGRGIYADLAWGFNFADHSSHDLPLSNNSTPTIDLGLSHPFGWRDVNLGLQYMHLSNAGLTEHNRGENFFLAMVSVRLH